MSDLSGDSDRGLGLNTKQARGDQRKKPPWVGIGDHRDRHVGTRHAFGNEDGRSAARERVRDEAGAIGVDAGKGSEQIAGLDLPAVGGQA